MCCVAAIAVLIGPRLGILVWWLFDMDRWGRAFDFFLWPLLGALFLPWTTLAYVLVFPDGVNGIDWLAIVIAALFDIGSYSGGRYSNRRRSNR